VPPPAPTTAPVALAAAQPAAPPPQPTPVTQPTAVPQAATAQAQTGGIPFTLKVNGVSQSLSVQPNWTLLYVLREQLDLTGTKYGCDRGMCGMCTIVADGKAIYSCMNLAVQHDGADIVTVEGLAQGSQLHPLQQSFLDHFAFQCAWCTPGFLMSAHALLQANRSPTMDQIKAGVAGNACRCGTYPKVFQAIDAAAGALRNPSQSPARPLTPGAPVAG
jgi:xanthine dehydrogenase YagT iron-sulfur-binding subunit